MTLLLTFAFGILGAILASFAAVVSERMHTGEPWWAGRSRCNACSRALDGWDLVPVLSWAVWRGACRTCRARIPSRYALAELALGTSFALSYLSLGLSAALPFLLVSLFFLAVIVLYDLRHTVVPLAWALVLIASSFGFAWLQSGATSAFAVHLIIAGSIGLAFFLLFALSGGRWMGLGDAPVALALSLLAGSVAVSGLLFSFWIGAVIGIGILVTHPKGHRMGIEVPFVPFLAAGYLLALFTQWNILPF